MKCSVKTPSSRMILLVLFLGWIVSYIDRIALNLGLLQIGDDLSLDASQLGVVLSSFFVGYALMQIPGGWLADRFGSRKVIVVAVLFWSLFTALTGLVWSLPSLLFIRFLFGIGEGAFPSASTKAISEYFPKGQRIKAQSTMFSSSAVGSAIAPIICSALLVWMGWRNLFLVISLLGIVILVLFILCTRNSGRYAHQDGLEEADKTNKRDYRQILQNPYLWKVLLIFFFINITNWGLLSWMPSYLMKVQGVDLKSVGLLSALPMVFATVGMIISGRIIHKIGPNSKFGVIIGSLMMGIMLYLISITSKLTLIIVYQCFAFTFGSFVNAFILTVPHRVMKQQVVGTAFGIINFGGQVAGILSPVIMGSLIATSGGSYKSAFLFLMVSCLIGAAVALLLPSSKKPPSSCP